MLYKYKFISKYNNLLNQLSSRAAYDDDINCGGCAVVPQPEDQSLIEHWQHLADLADFALAMKVTLSNLNKQSFNNFMLRIG